MTGSLPRSGEIRNTTDGDGQLVSIQLAFSYQRVAYQRVAYQLMGYAQATPTAYGLQMVLLEVLSACRVSAFSFQLLNKTANHLFNKIRGIPQPGLWPGYANVQVGDG
ncbi:hypothetical protein [Moorena sp. SIO2C4]|uniref:Uncharacterized protein n=2 Tax=Moorena TaxID=1155738 RepID=F4XK22_9CYAN|nr:hypothetical protein [Moorena sp. SIO2C4]EGJ34981.1 hypothetical protein LYNGBM3L_10930 [Moorena producens 3L]NEQ10179.1 hypothetical protein [Moorena sp. SIO4E2]NEQ15549.1 hypothetical protein [Moorena sp. SIO3E2]NES45006.1 hypothetical protein [Moorena sp. SIO2C4]